MDHYVPIPKKRPQQILRSGPRQPLADPCPAQASIKPLLKHQSKGQHLPSCQTKPPIQTPYTPFTLHRARSGWVLPRFIHHPLSPNRLPPIQCR